MVRYTDTPFPPYAYLPGKQHPHPLKAGGHMEETGEPRNVPPMDPQNPSSSEAFLYAVDLFNHRYYWEAHVWWEALWNGAKAKRQSRRETDFLADFLKGLIKLAAAGVKFQLGQERAARGHCDRAVELLESMPDSPVAGLSFASLLAMGRSYRLGKMELLERS